MKKIKFDKPRTKIEPKLAKFQPLQIILTLNLSSLCHTPLHRKIKQNDEI